MANMPDLGDLWALASALKTSLPFAAALPIFVATVFANVADWLEAYLATHQAPGDQIGEAERPKWKRPGEGHSPSEWPVFGDHARNQESA
jgi:hypothetical protein